MSVGVSISKLCHGATGYLLYEPVVETLVRAGFNPSDIRQPGKLNQAIDAAARLQLTAPNAVNDWGDDKGYSDFTTLAFKFFGLRIEALHYFYFFLLALTSITFALRFFWDTGALAALAAMLSAHWLVATTLTNSSVTSVIHDARVLPAVSCIAVLHWLLALRSTPESRLGLATLSIQLAIILFVVNCRASSVWQLMLIGGFAAYYAIGRREKWKAIVPLVFVIAGIGVSGLHKYLNYHQIYKDSGTQSHVFWHNIYMGLGFHPAAIATFDLLPDDGTIYRHAVTYIQKHPELGMTHVKYPVFEQIGWRRYDEIVGKMYRDFAVAHPTYFLATYFVFKPALLGHAVAWQLGLVKDYPTWIVTREGHRPQGQKRISLLNPWLIGVAFIISLVSTPTKGVATCLVAVAVASLIPSLIVGPFYYELPPVFTLIVAVLIYVASSCAFTLVRMLPFRLGFGRFQ